MQRGGRAKGAPAPGTGPRAEREREGKKKARARDEDDDEDVEEEEMARKGPSESRKWQAAATGAGLGKRQPRQTTLSFALQLEASTNERVAVNDEYVPPQVEGSGLDVIARNSEREAGLAAAERARQGDGREKQKKGHKLDPANMDGINSACWVFFRTAKEGEHQGYVYCLACERLNNGAKQNASNRVAIADYGKPEAHLHASNAKSHLKQHKNWWRVVKDASSKGLDPRAAFVDLMAKTEKRKVQGQSTLDRRLKKADEKAGLLEKELRLVIWLVRNNIPFNAVDDIAFCELLTSFGLKLSSSKTLKRYLLLLSEIALRHGEKQIKEAGMYSIALDYWTSLAKDKYLGITYHYCDKDLNVRARVLDLVPVGGNATALLTKELVDQRLVQHFEEKRSLFK
jgi:hypothetical protein